MTNARSVSSARPAPISGSHQPPSPPAAAVAGQRVEDQHGVVAGGIQLSPGAIGEGDAGRAGRPARDRAVRCPSKREAASSAGVDRVAAGGDDAQPAAVLGRSSLGCSAVVRRIFGHRHRRSPLVRWTCASSGCRRHDRSRSETLANKKPPPEQGCDIIAVPLSRRSLCRNWHLASATAGCRASQGRIPPPLLIRQHSSVVDRESTE